MRTPPGLIAITRLHLRVERAFSISIIVAAMDDKIASQSCLDSDPLDKSLARQSRFMEATPVVPQPSTNQLPHMSVFCVLLGLLIHYSAFRSLVHAMMEGYIHVPRLLRSGSANSHYSNHPPNNGSSGSRFRGMNS